MLYTSPCTHGKSYSKFCESVHSPSTSSTGINRDHVRIAEHQASLRLCKQNLHGNKIPGDSKAHLNLRDTVWGLLKRNRLAEKNTYFFNFIRYCQIVLQSSYVAMQFHQKLDIFIPASQLDVKCHVIMALMWIVPIPNEVEHPFMDFLFLAAFYEFHGNWSMWYPNILWQIFHCFLWYDSVPLCQLKHVKKVLLALFILSFLSKNVPFSVISSFLLYLIGGAAGCVNIQKFQLPRY